ncbi:hypothetical protein ACFUV2_28175 [Streptomyces pilosus]|uniref:hypothetical protein n=1 Tax=Streptomyces pilosus TaxID=28893 RepID=UPI003641F25A
MNDGFDTVVAMAVEATGKAEGPSPLHISLSLSVGVLIALAAGFLHRADRPDPSRPRYSVPAAVMRAGITLFGAAFLMLGTLMCPQRGANFLVLLLSSVAGVIYGLLAYYDNNTVQTAIWRGATIAGTASGLGQAFLALY